MNPPKMPFHIGDYKRDTGHLRAAQHGAYLMLMFHYWSTGSLPDDDEQLAAIACMTRGEWSKNKPIIQAFFKDGWKKPRIDDDLATAKASYERRAKAGGKGGKAKAMSQQSSSNATAGPEQPLTLNLIPEREEEPASAGPPSSKDPYAFESGVIRLTQEHFDNWAKSFSNLNLRAELLAKTEWAGSLPKGRWFHALPNVLAKLDREVAIKKAKEHNGSGFKTMSGIDGVI